MQHSMQCEVENSKASLQDTVTRTPHGARGGRLGARRWGECRLQASMFGESHPRLCC